MFPHAWCAEGDTNSFCQTSSPSSESTAYKVFASAKSAKSLNPRPVIKPGKRSGSLNDHVFAGPFPSLSFQRNLKSLATVAVVMSVSAFCQLLCAESCPGTGQNPRGGPWACAAAESKTAPARQSATGC